MSLCLKHYLSISRTCTTSLYFLGWGYKKEPPLPEVSACWMILFIAVRLWKTRLSHKIEKILEQKKTLFYWQQRFLEKLYIFKSHPSLFPVWNRYRRSYSWLRLPTTFVLFFQSGCITSISAAFIARYTYNFNRI